MFAGFKVLDQRSGKHKGLTEKYEGRGDGDTELRRKSRFSQQARSMHQAVSHKGQLGKQSKRGDKSKVVKWGDTQGEHQRGGVGNDKLGTSDKRGRGDSSNKQQKKLTQRQKESSGCGSTPVDKQSRWGGARRCLATVAHQARRQQDKTTTLGKHSERVKLTSPKMSGKGKN